jgi:formate hydrogenlyase subunit 6/NADH:ubiquinone oxidoreductase subunit I
MNLRYCEYQCTLCGQVCPTRAIRRLSQEEKTRTKIGCAEIDRTRCLPSAKGTDCLVCEEHCPVSNKAIKKTERIYNGKQIGMPVIDPSLCVGCGICQNVCPVRPRRAVVVHSI